MTYTLAGAIDPETGWGRLGETWLAMEELRTLSDGRLSWFNLGDRDLGTHLYRTARLAEGATLSQVTTEIAARWGLGLRVLPMSDDRVATGVTLAPPGAGAAAGAGARKQPGPEIGFQEYFVGHHHSVPVAAVRFAGIEAASLPPGCWPPLPKPTSRHPAIQPGGVDRARAFRIHLFSFTSRSALFSLLKSINNIPIACSPTASRLPSGELRQRMPSFSIFNINALHAGSGTGNEFW